MTVFALYAKPPLPGRTKSRLARDIGDAPAASLAAALLQDALAALRACAVDPAILALGPIRVELWHPPDSDPADFGVLGDGVDAMRVQRGAHLGARMADTLAAGFAAGAERLLILGSDCATHSVETLREAVQALAVPASADAAGSTASTLLRPAADGGYVLVGQRRAALANPAGTAAIFGALPWGGATVLRDTRRAAAAHGLALRELAPTFDIDLVQDLAPLALALRSLDRPSGMPASSASGALAPRSATRTWLRDHAATLPATALAWLPAV